MVMGQRRPHLLKLETFNVRDEKGHHYVRRFNGSGN